MVTLELKSRPNQQALCMQLLSSTKSNRSFGPALGVVGLCLLCVMLLSGCGKRPSQLDVPEGGAPKPRIYPDLATDPMP